VDQAYRNAILAHTENVHVKGIFAHRFQPSKALLSYDAKSPNPGVGYPYDGVQDLTFAEGFPTYVSHPYFLFGDPRLIAGDDWAGVQYKNFVKSDLTFEKFGTWLDIEPASGKTISAHKRLQSAFALGAYSFPTNQSHISVSTISSPAVVPSKIIPQFWVDETACLGDSDASSLRTAITMRRAAHYWWLMVLFAVGLVLGGLHARGSLIPIVSTSEKENPEADSFYNKYEDGDLTQPLTRPSDGAVQAGSGNNATRPPAVGISRLAREPTNQRDL
jgi:hypothetical protein